MLFLCFLELDYLKNRTTKWHLYTLETCMLTSLRLCSLRSSQQLDQVWKWSNNLWNRLLIALISSYFQFYRFAFVVTSFLVAHLVMLMLTSSNLLMVSHFLRLLNLKLIISPFLKYCIVVNDKLYDDDGVFSSRLLFLSITTLEFHNL